MDSQRAKESAHMLIGDYYPHRHCACKRHKLMVAVTLVICFLTCLLVVSCTAYVASVAREVLERSHPAATSQQGALDVTSQTSGYFPESVELEEYFEEEDEEEEWEEDKDGEEQEEEDDGLWEISGEQADLKEENPTDGKVRQKRSVIRTTQSLKKGGRNKSKNRRGGRKNRGRKKIMTVHYPGELAEERYSPRGSYDTYTMRVGDGCGYDDEFGGEICRNGTYIPYSKEIKIFQASDEKDSPLTMDRNKGFVVKKSGVILAYAQVTFNRSVTMRNGVMLDQIRGSNVEPIRRLLNLQTGPGTSPAYVMGLFYVDKGDVLSVVSRNERSHVITTKGATYFGAVQLVS